MHNPDGGPAFPGPAPRVMSSVCRASGRAPGAPHNAGGMRRGEFDEALFFRAIHESGARALLIGRRALVLLGLPVLTADYDFGLAIDDGDVFQRRAGAMRVVSHPHSR